MENHTLDPNVMLKINSLNDTKTLNYRAHVLESHMYMGDLKYQFLDFIENEYEHKCNKQLDALSKKS